jgi:hypothetical protein
MASTPESPTDAALSKLPLSERLKALVLEYGMIGVCVFLSTFVLTLSGSFLALSLGLKVGGAAPTAGTFWGTLGAAYLIALATKPVRIALTLAITPAVAAFIRRHRKPAPDAPVSDAPVSEPSVTPSVAGRQSQK